MVKRKHVDSPSKTHTKQLTTHCILYILGLIGGVLMPDKSGNKVHLMYLPPLANLDRDDRYSRGSTCLAHFIEKCVEQFIPHPKNWEDVQCC